MDATARADHPTTGTRRCTRWAVIAVLATLALTSCATSTDVPGQDEKMGEANLQLPDLGSVDFLGLPGNVLLGLGLIVCALGLVFGIVTYRQLSGLPVQESMREISELIYATCKTYLKQQGKFLLVLWHSLRRSSCCTTCSWSRLASAAPPSWCCSR